LTARFDTARPAATAGPDARHAEAAAVFTARFRAIADSIEQIIYGKREVIELALVCLLAEGHLLIEDVPGVGKTTLARCLAGAIDASWHRIQFTPDLLPSDITGVSVYHQDSQSFQFHPGPVFASIVLGDEINRASPKTQSALLEVMEERRVTVDAVQHPAPRPFMVIATQNPVDMDGTYPLPEAQLDRFLMRLTVGYPAHEAEVAVLAGEPSALVTEIKPVTSAAEVGKLIALAARTYVARPLYDYIVKLAAATRASQDVRLGASPRGSVALLRAVRVRAAASGRSYALPDDVKALAPHVLAHRLLLVPETSLRSLTAAHVINSVLSSVPVPAPRAGG
jgi:MoxR-like ATPase